MARVQILTSGSYRRLSDCPNNADTIQISLLENNFRRQTNIFSSKNTERLYRKAKAATAAPAIPIPCCTRWAAPAVLGVAVVEAGTVVVPETAGVTEVIVAVATVLPVAMVIVPLIEATTAPVLLSPVLLPVAEGVAEGVDVGVPVLAAPLAHEATLGRVTSAT